MWMDEEDAHLDEQNQGGLIDRFKSMLKTSSNIYFDVDQLEIIIDYYLERGMPKQALKAANHGLSMFEDNNFLTLRKGQILISIGDLDKGKAILSDLSEKDKENAEILFGLGMANAQQRNPTRAINYYKKAFDYADEELKAEILIELALQYQLTGAPSQSIRCYDKALDFNKNTNLIFRELTNCAFRNDQLIEAEAVIERHLDKNPYNELAWFFLGKLFFDFKLYKKALEAYDFSLAIKPEYGLVYYKKAEVYIKQNEYELALIELHQEIKYREPMPLNYCIMADCYEHLNEFGKAEEYYKKAIELDDTFSEAYIGLGFLKEIQFDYKSAIPYYKKSIEIDPENYNAYLMLSSVYVELGNTEQAKKVVTSLLAEEEGLEEAWIELAYIYSEDDDLAKSLAILDEGIETAFSNEQIWLKKVVYLHKIGKRNEAIDLARELLTEDQGIKTALSNLNSELLEDPEFIQLLNEF